MNVADTLNKIGITTTMGPNKAIFDVSSIINDSSDRHRTANKILTQLGIPSIDKERHAIVFTQSVVEYAVKNIKEFNVENAISAAKQRTDALFKDMPWMFAETTKKVQSKPKSEGLDPADKKTAALKIFKSNLDKTNHAIAKIIASELNINYSNASYYVFRVFKKEFNR